MALASAVIGQRAATAKQNGRDEKPESKQNSRGWLGDGDADGRRAGTERLAEVGLPAVVVVDVDAGSVVVRRRIGTVESIAPDGEVGRVDNFERVSLLLASDF